MEVQAGQSLVSARVSESVLRSGRPDERVTRSSVLRTLQPAPARFLHSIRFLLKDVDGRRTRARLLVCSAGARGHLLVDSGAQCRYYGSKRRPYGDQQCTMFHHQDSPGLAHRVVLGNRNWQIETADWIWDADRSLFPSSHKKTLKETYFVINSLSGSKTVVSISRNHPVLTRRDLGAFFF
jgi:hypothetical protein